MVFLKRRRRLEKLDSDGGTSSTLPPNMRPQKVRHLLSDYGEVGRVYLAAEDAAVRRGKRQAAAAATAANANASSSSNNNNKKKLAARAPKRFTEGWVEFEDKNDAKRVALALNGQPVGGRPRSSHRHDLWCLKYLRGFKWDDLTEEIAAQNAAREARLAAEAAAAARERDFYLGKVDEARGREAIRKRRLAKAEKEGIEGDSAAAAAAAVTAPAPPKRTFRQNRVFLKGGEGEGAEEAGPAAAKRRRRAGEEGVGGGLSTTTTKTTTTSSSLGARTLALIAGRE